MRQLLLLRHAKSSWDDPKLSDHARALNARGRRAAETMRLAMRELGLAPDVILVSSARRTLQTLEALEPWDETPLIEPMDSLYLASAQQLLAALRGVAETVRSVLLIAHNPGLHDLARGLVGSQRLLSQKPELRRLAEAYPTAALAEFAVGSPWSALDEEADPAHAPRLVRFLCPNDLPELTA